MHRIALFASGSGTNAENIAQALAGSDRAMVVLLLANKAEAGAHGRMKPFGIPTDTYDNDIWANHPEIILDRLREAGVDFIALCGFLRKIHPEIVSAYDGRMLNIHPSLLPLHGGKGMYGMKVHQAVVDAREAESGATVHYVNDEMDEGAILLQGRVNVTPDDDAHAVAEKVHAVEMDIYPRAIELALDRLDDKQS